MGVGRADHDILVDGGVVEAFFQQLGARQRSAALDVGGVARAERNVAGGVFVKQRVIEQHAAAVDGAGRRDERDLADAVGVLVGGQQFGQQGGVFLGPVLDDFAVLKGDVPALDELPVVGVGFGAVDDAVDAGTVRRAKYFLGRDVGDELDATLRLAGRALPGGVLRQADGQVGAVAAGDVHAVEVPGVELVAAGRRFGDMFTPGGDGVAGGDAADVKNHFPQFFHRFLDGQVGEHLGRPAGGRHRDDAPLHAVVHRVLLPGFHGGAARQVDAVDLAGVQPRQSLGVRRMDGQRAAAVGVLGIVEIAAQLIGFELAEVAFLRKFHVQAGELVVLPPDDDVLGAGFIPGAHAGVGKRRHSDRAAHDKVLARAHVDAHLDDKIGIQLQILLVHGCKLLFVLFIFLSIHHLPPKV